MKTLDLSMALPSTAPAIEAHRQLNCGPRYETLIHQHFYAGVWSNWDKNTHLWTLEIDELLEPTWLEDGPQRTRSIAVFTYETLEQALESLHRIVRANLSHEVC